MIGSFRHKGLRRLFEGDDRRGVNASHADKIERILARLDAAEDVRHMALPGFRLHPLKGDLKGFWAVSVSGNWRITFKFVGKDADAVDYEDYH